MTRDEMMKWIDETSYADLLRKQRTEPLESPFFQGAVGVHYQRIMALRWGEVWIRKAKYSGSGDLVCMNCGRSKPLGKPCKRCVND